jgi:hypothetical protein
MAAEPTSDTRDFAIGDVITVTSGRLIGPSGVDGIYEILGFLTDGPVFTHALPTVARLVEPSLYDQYPWLKNVDVPAGLDTEEKCKAFVAKIAAVRGETLTLRRVPKEIYQAPETPEELVAEYSEIRKRVHRGVSE